MAYSIVQTTGWTLGSGGGGTTPAFPSATTLGNTLVLLAHIERYDATPSADPAPTSSRSGGETFTRLGFDTADIGGGTYMHLNVFAAECSTAATTGVSVVETIGANSDVGPICAIEVSGLASVGSLLLAMQSGFVNYPGTGDRNGPALGVLSGQPALLLSVGIERGGGVALGNASANTLITANSTLHVLSHRRLTSTDSVEGSVNLSSDGNAMISGIALLEGSGGGSSASTKSAFYRMLRAA
jgi:hypothetical protein